ncbi:uncharacterized protein BO97DRAFT_161190 [Aspergillus homomorphus CBS 101889]|uniref:Uncharacterized protein n=1 Tax=Aspergillus homomorphus (strain CBS 101889) TaxID=1450537 RepID=A0A395HQN3_ASPHC|nr:hypothetical protein BO97DRAFT_161190 [Aspergillus homomorphus CBS 101889]RAL09605.1 hypothetical protein BO97DRAFT_161190 [Aspergillus homomorphus CBS 101889]
MTPKNTNSYFLLGNPYYPPDEAICLGQIVTDLRAPFRPLARPRLPLPPIHSLVQTDYTCSQSSLNSHSGGLTAAFLAQLGSPLSADASLQSSRSETQEWHVDRLETYSIEPDESYVRESVFGGGAGAGVGPVGPDSQSKSPVQDYLMRGRLLGKAVYMITGVKVGKGLKFQRVSGSDFSADASVKLDATALAGVPVQAGPKTGLKNQKEVHESFEVSAAFVFAYRVRKIFVGWRPSKGVRTREVFGGQLLGMDDDSDYVDEIEDDDDDDDEEDEEIGVVKLEKRDLGEDYAPRGFQRVILKDEGTGEECRVLV